MLKPCEQREMGSFEGADCHGVTPLMKLCITESRTARYFVLPHVIYHPWSIFCLPSPLLRGNLHLIMAVELIGSLQEIQGIEKLAKGHNRDAISRIQHERKLFGWLLQQIKIQERKQRGFSMQKSNEPIVNEYINKIPLHVY